MPDFLEEINEKIASAHVQLGVLDLGFRLICSSLLLAKNLGSRDHAAYSKVYFSSSYLDSILTLRPYLCPELMSFRVSVNMSCE